MTIPPELHELSGAYRKNSQRRPKPVPKSPYPLGDPPKNFEPDERNCWREIQSILPPSVLVSSDRWMVEVACRLMAKFRARERMPVGEVSLLSHLLSKLGASPVDRARLQSVEKTDSSDLDDLISA